MNAITPTSYRLQTVATGRIFDDNGWVLDDPQCDQPSLVRAVYEKKQLEPLGLEYGIYRFADWLPVRRMLQGSCAPVTYKSEKLTKELKLNNLYITFSGWYPEIGAKMSTCSFKETEAYSVCGRLDPACGKVLVVASAGNTARAFAKVCSENHIPLLLSVPADNL
ncbi:MAG: cysteate synthase, partial [Bacteroidales bacterium]|nr:cysteate synthase [Bacteroidales bacterium]